MSGDWQEKAYSVALLSPEGREERLDLAIAYDGVRLIQLDGQLVNHIGYDIIRKWLPSNLRSRNAGADDCLDLQIETDRGPRELRMRCVNAATVNQIVRDLSDVAKLVMEQAEAASSPQQQPGRNMGPAAAVPSTSGRYEQRGPLPAGGMGFGSNAGQYQNALDSARQLRQQREAEQQHEAAVRHLASRSLAGLQQAPGNPSSQPVRLEAAFDQATTSRHPRDARDVGFTAGAGRGGGSAGQDALGMALLGGGGRPFPSMGRSLVPETELLTLPGFGADLAGISGGAGAASQMREMTEQIKFLEGLVHRLSTELARHPDVAPPPDAARSNESADDDMPLPPWLKDRRYLNPLLAAYDKRIQLVGDELALRNEALEELQQQTDEVISENERLHAELSRALEDRAAMVMLQPTGSSALGSEAVDREAAALAAERYDLLRQENQMLTQQQQDLDGEMRRLSHKLDEVTEEKLVMSRELAAFQAAAHASHNKCQDLESRVVRNGSALKSAEARVIQLAQQLATTQSSLEDETAAAAGARQALDELQRQAGVLQKEALASQSRMQAAINNAAALQAELSSVKEKYEVSSSELKASESAAGQLRQALTTVEARLTDYQRKDAEVYTRIREAMEVAEAARLARDSVLARQRDLELEVQTLKERLAAVRQQTRNEVYEDLQGQLHELRDQLVNVQQEVDGRDRQISEARVAADRLVRENKGLFAELTSLKEDMGDTLHSKSRLGLMSLTALEKIQEVERERDEAASRFETAHRRAERAARDWQIERQQCEYELRELRRRVTELEASATSARAEGAGHLRQLDAAVKEAQALKAARAKVEADLRGQIAALRTTHDAELQAMAAKSESTLASFSQLTAEAERRMQSKDEQLAKCREDARAISMRYERALAEAKQEKDARHAEAAVLQQQGAALQQENMALAHDLAEAQAASEELQAALEDTERRLAHITMQCNQSDVRRDELDQELKAQQSLLERVRLDKSRVDRAADPIDAKYAALMRAKPPAMRVDGPVGWADGAVVISAGRYSAAALAAARPA